MMGILLSKKYISRWTVYTDRYYSTCIYNSCYICESIITLFLLSKNVKVRLAEYLRHKFDFEVVYGKRAKTKIDRVINCNSIINQKHRKHISLKRRPVDNYNNITRHNTYNKILLCNNLLSRYDLCYYIGELLNEKILYSLFLKPLGRLTV